MNHFLITGGAGFVGSHLAEKLTDMGNEVTIYDDLHTGKISNLEKIIDKINFVKGDIRNFSHLEKICENVDGIFHQAARASVQESFQKPEEYFEVNVKGTKNIFTIAQKKNLKVIFASSSSVYGNPAFLPINEKSDLNPINPYAETKVAKEKLASEFSRNGLEVIGLRYFNIFGKRQSKEYAGVITLFLDRIKKKNPLKINGDGLQVRDFVNVDDVVTANIAAMNSKIKDGFFNVGSGTSISILEIAEIILKLSQLDLKINFSPPLDGDIRKSQADIRKIKKNLKWKPTKYLEKWLEEEIYNLKQVNLNYN